LGFSSELDVINTSTAASPERWLQPNMTIVISKCEDVLNELYKFSESILSLGDSITDSRIEELEKQVGFELPLDFKYIMSKHNYLSLGGTEVLSIGKEFENQSIQSLYLFEHEEVGNPMLKEFLPFSPDGAGNHYCLDLSKLENGICPIVFWQHDYHYDNKAEVEICNPNFYEWIKEVMIDWTFEDTNYDGTDKV